jgi:hypothetical protein
MAKGTAESPAKAQVFMFTHQTDNGRYLYRGRVLGRKFEQVSFIVCFTAMAGSETECMSARVSLCDLIV